jgi:hypothetical protein
MKRLPLLLSVALFPLVAVAAEPTMSNNGPEPGQWVWCESDASGQTGAPERAELLIAGSSLSGRLLVNGTDYAKIDGAIKLASENTGLDGATTHVWVITATETTGGHGQPEHRLVLKGTYTKYHSAAYDPNARVGSYETLALSKSDEPGAAVIISRMQSTTLQQGAAR